MTSQSKITALAGVALLCAAMPGSVLLPGLAHADDKLRCQVSHTEANPGIEYREPFGNGWSYSYSGQAPAHTDIQCQVTADNVNIGNVIVNRGNCQASDAAKGEHKYGDELNIPVLCPSVIEFSVEVDAETITFNTN